MPATFEETVPAAAGVLVRLSRRPKLAVTDFAASTVSVQVVPVPAQSPDHDANTHPEAGVAVSVTEVPSVNGPLQVDPQLMPEGVDRTVPVPVRPTVTVYVTGREKVAVTCCAAEIAVKVHDVPEQDPASSPDHPEKIDPEDAEAESDTSVPPVNDDEHVPGQEIPAGEDVTVPDPVPAFVTVTVRAPHVGNLNVPMRVVHNPVPEAM